MSALSIGIPERLKLIVFLDLSGLSPPPFFDPKGLCPDVTYLASIVTSLVGKPLIQIVILPNKYLSINFQILKSEVIMKNFMLFIFVLIVCCQTQVSSQPCLPEGIIFTTQEEIDNFQTNYPGCTEIEGNVTINGDDITNLNGLNVLTAFWGNLLIGDTIYPFSGNPSLASLEGLENLTFIGENLWIFANDSIASLTGLENLATIEGDLQIGGSYGGNSSLTSLTGLDNVTSIVGNLEISHNHNLSSLMGLENVTFIGGDFYIGDNVLLTNLTGLENLTIVEGDLNVGFVVGLWGSYLCFGNPSLTNLAGLNNLVTIGGDLSIQCNNSLNSLTGLENLTTIEESFIIGFSVCNWPNSYYVGNSSLASLNGLNNLTFIEDHLVILGNDSLTSLTGLYNVVSIGGSIAIHDNNSLMSLIGLNNVDAGSIEGLNISWNSSLYTCEVQSVCDYLANPNGSVLISNNASGCNSQEEVEAACESVSIGELSFGNTFIISPNPLESNTLIEYTLHHNSPVILQIFDLSGQVIVTLIDEFQQQGKNEVVFNCSGVTAGIYFCVLQTNEGIQTQKMIKL